MRHGIEDHIAELARRQHGVVSLAQLLHLGLTPGTVRRRASTRRLCRVHRGVYLVGPFAQRYTPEMAAVLACGPTAVLSHHSAAAVWELLARRDSLPVGITVVSGHLRRRDGIHVRRTTRLLADERSERLGIPVTAPARTLIDLAGEVHASDLERALAVADRERLITFSEIDAMMTRHARRAGVPALRAALRSAGGPALTRSEAESRFLALVRQTRLPMPDVNVRLGGYEIDFLWRAERLAVEVDGFRYHSSRTRFENDRRRTAQLAAHGIQTIRLTWRQIVDDPLATAVLLGQALAHAVSR